MIGFNWSAGSPKPSVIKKDWFSNPVKKEDLMLEFEPIIWSNIWWWVTFLIVELTVAIIMFKLWGKAGLYTALVASIIVANIQVVKTVNLFGMIATLGNIIYASVFFCTDVLSEVYGKKSARKGVWLGFAALIVMTIEMQLALKFIPHASDFASESLQVIFGLMPRIAAGSLIAYLISQHYDIFAFHFWKDKTKGKYLWLRNNLSTMVSQAIDSIIFCSIAFIGVFPWNIWLQILITTYILKWVVAALDTPFIYWARHFGKKIVEKEEREMRNLIGAQGLK